MSQKQLLTPTGIFTVDKAIGHVVDGLQKWGDPFYAWESLQTFYETLQAYIDVDKDCEKTFIEIKQYVAIHGIGLAVDPMNIKVNREDDIVSYSARATRKKAWSKLHDLGVRYAFYV